MKTPHLSLLIPLCLLNPLPAQETAPAAPPATGKPSLEFLGKKYTLGEVKRTKATAQNTYFQAKDSPKAWVQKLNVTLHPGQSDIRKARDLMIGFYRKQNHETEVGKLDTPRIVSFFAYEKHPNVHIFNVHTITNGANGKGVVVRTFSSKNLPKNEADFRARIEKVKEAYLSKLALAKFPRFVLGKPPAEQPAPKLKAIGEKVTDIRGKGQEFTIDDAFAKANGAAPGGHRPFTVNVPKSELGTMAMQARPKVKEVVRFSLVDRGGKKLLESIRFTGMTSPAGVPMEQRLAHMAALVEKQMVPAFFKGHKDGRIGMRYRTKVGPYDAACLLGRMTAADGTMFYVKFVAIVPGNGPRGIVAVMLLNPTGDNPGNIKKRLQDGFAQQVLHSLRFKE